MEELFSDKEYPRILDMNKRACEASILIQVQWKETRVCSIQNMCSTRKVEGGRGTVCSNGFYANI